MNPPPFHSQFPECNRVAFHVSQSPYPTLINDSKENNFYISHTIPALPTHMQLTTSQSLSVNATDTATTTASSSVLLAGSNSNSNSSALVTAQYSKPAAVHSSCRSSSVIDPKRQQSKKSTAAAVRVPSLNIHSEHLDIELIKYLYQVYFNKKILRHELTAKMKRQSEQQPLNQRQQSNKDCCGESTPKRTPSSSLLRVTYFDDFDLFQTGAGGGTTTTTDNLIGPSGQEKGSNNNKIHSNNYNKSNSADDLDSCRRWISVIPGSGPNKSHSLDKPCQRRGSSEKEIISLSETAAVPYEVRCGAAAAAAAAPGASSSSVECSPNLGSHVSTTSSSTELFESSRSCVEANFEEEFQTPPPRSRESSTTSSGLVSCASKVNDETLVADGENNTSGDTSARQVVPGGGGGCSSDFSCCSSSSRASSTTTTLRSSVEEQKPFSDYHHRTVDYERPRVGLGHKK